MELAVVKSPIVGTFYRAAEPGAKPFTEVGEMVKKGQVLCIIEAMKLMNEINAEIDGEVVKVYVENSQAVQYGERLFAIRPVVASMFTVMSHRDTEAQRFSVMSVSLCLSWLLESTIDECSRKS